MEAWFTSNLILTAIVAPTVSLLAVNSAYEISSWNRVVYKLAQPSSAASQKIANDFAYEVKLQAREAETAAAVAGLSEPQ